MKVKIDITKFCDYDGECLLSKTNVEEGFVFCDEHYGKKFGTKECPLKNKTAIIEIKDEKLDDLPSEVLEELENCEDEDEI